MDDDDFFGVQVPESGIIGYCSVLGELGDVFGLALYPGERGYECYQRVITGAADARDFETAVSLDSLLVSFEDRSALHARDLAVIKDLGLRFRGRNAWPLFRSYRPGCEPWFLVGWEVRLLATSLEQAPEVSSRVAAGLDLCEREDEGLVFIRSQGTHNAWEDTWQPAPMPLPPVPAPRPSAGRLRETAASLLTSQRIWEAGLMHMPTVIQERGQRPYYPRTWLCADSETGAIVGIDLSEPQSAEADLQEAFIAQLELGGLRPAELHVAQDEAFRLLEPLAGPLNICLRRSSHMPAYESARQSLISYFQA